MTQGFITLGELINKKVKVPSKHEEFTEDDKIRIQTYLKTELDNCPSTDYEARLIEFFDGVQESVHPDALAAIVDEVERANSDEEFDLWNDSYDLMCLRTMEAEAENWTNMVYHRLTPKVIGLDIDGVLNSHRGSSLSGWGGARLYEVLRNPEVAKQFDQFGLAFLRNLCRVAGVSIVLVTQQRIGMGPLSIRALASFLDLPIVGRTRSFGARKDEIMEYLNQNPMIQQFASVDDEYYYVDIEKATERDLTDLATKSTHVRIDQHNGILYHDMVKLSEFFGVRVNDTFQKNHD